MRSPIVRLALLPIAGVAVLLLGACGGGDGTSSDSPTSTASIVEGSRTGRIPQGAPEVDQDNLQFKPGSLDVKAGDKVYFKNSETAIHTVTINGTNVSATMKQNDIVEWTVPAPGVYRVTCDFHPQMKATLTAQ